MVCRKNQINLCGKKECKICFERSFASYKRTTPKDDKVLIVDCWDYEKNGDIKPIDIRIGSGFIYWFKCSYCPHSFQKSPHNITTSNSWCKYCCNTNKKLCEDKVCDYCFKRSFANCKTKTPNGNMVVDCFNYEKNGKVDLYKITMCDNIKFYFKCDNCPHNFEARIYNIKNGYWCPYCCNSSTKLCGDKNCNYCFKKSFANCKLRTPNGNLIIKCYDHKNNNLKLFNISITSNKKRWFKCDNCPHKFDTVISHLIVQKSWCPYCCIPHKKFCEDRSCEFCYNKSFADYKGKTPSGKLIVDCFNQEKNNKTMDRITKGTDTKYIFNCDVCPNYFPIAINKIILLGRWCPDCKNKTEGKFKHYFKKEYPELKLKHQAKYEWCKNKKCLPFDFAVEELKIIIEIDGEQHFSQVSNWSPPEENRENDFLKMDKAIKNSYSIIRLLQQDIWNDTNNWKEKLKEILIKHTKPSIFYIGCQDKYKDHIEYIS
jgi:very-short-patch-repair endonuclease